LNGCFAWLLSKYIAPLLTYLCLVSVFEAEIECKLLLMAIFQQEEAIKAAQTMFSSLWMSAVYQLLIIFV